tara:strand:+ start:49 stop:282 length:234 start_codon:yes stop_codon:yes gene_type:complete
MIKLHPETANAIIDAFDNYALWSKVRNDESSENKRYSIYRQAKAVMVLVNLGIPHHLREWAEETLADDFYTKADYMA